VLIETYVIKLFSTQTHTWEQPN